MSDYLKNLQETVMLTESFSRSKSSITEEEILDELREIFTEEELSELDMGQLLGHTVISLTKGETAMAGIAAAAAIIAAVYKLAKTVGTYPECKRFSKAGDIKKCNGIVNRRKQIQALKAKSNLCANSKDSKACMKKIVEKMKELNVIIKKYQEELKIKV